MSMDKNNITGKDQIISKTSKAVSDVVPQVKKKYTKAIVNMLDLSKK
ncbi:MAG: hypothetical protein LBF27_04770 [Sphingobacterium sp.]|jgi:hypothetical protein|nr:hypothetical protein [Sphingobacterium sp.]